MADTPLHEHPAVLHLMGTEHWPTDTDENGQHCRLSWEVVDDDGRFGWCFLRNQGAVLREVSNSLAHSLITLAAVRGMWAKGAKVLVQPRPDGTYIAAYYVEGWMPKWPHGFSFAPTEPRAILAAYQATVMGKENSK